MPAVSAVLFDWGNTLVHFEWSDELLAVGHRAGLAAVGREADADAFTERFCADLLPRLSPADDYPALLQAELGLAEDESRRFLEAEHRAWRPARALVGSAHALLEALRDRGLLLAVVANHWPEPAELVRAEIEELGVSSRVDAVVLSGEVGVRKPAPAIFLRALDELGAEASDAVFVGDRLVADVQGAGDLGMTTVQALWFRADEHTGGPEPDFLAFTPMDVLNAVRRLGAVA